MRKSFAGIAVVLIVSLLLGLSGCWELDSCEATVPDPVVKTLDKELHFVTVSANGEISEAFKAQVNATVTDYAEAEDTFTMTIDLPEGSSLVFDESATFEVQYEDQDLPYYCVSARIYHPISDAYMPYHIAVDFEKEYIVLKIATSELLSYTLAATSPDASISDIKEHFESFFELYKAPSVNTEE